MDSEYDDRDLDGQLAEESARWPMSWQGLYPRERWLWFEQLWSDVCMLRQRYRLPVRPLGLVGERRARRNARRARGVGGPV